MPQVRYHPGQVALRCTLSNKFVFLFLGMPCLNAVVQVDRRKNHLPADKCEKGDSHNGTAVEGFV